MLGSSSRSQYTRFTPARFVARSLRTTLPAWSSTTSDSRWAGAFSQ